MARRALDPYPSHNFEFILEIGGLQAAGFAECNGLQMETKLFQYKEGGRNETTLQFPEHTSYGNITLKRGITFSDNVLYEWHKDIVTGQFSKNRRSQSTLRKNAKSTAIILQDELGDEVGRWTLIGAIPVKWVGPDLKATGNEIAIETLEIAHEGIEIG